MAASKLRARARGSHGTTDELADILVDFGQQTPTICSYPDESENVMKATLKRTMSCLDGFVSSRKISASLRT